MNIYEKKGMNEEKNQYWSLYYQCKNLNDFKEFFIEFNLNVYICV